MERKKLRFEFDQLKNQIDPHFLFNSLNSLSGLIEETPEKAIHSVNQLSNLYRSILDYSNLDYIQLDKEVELAKEYFHIHKLRYQDLINLEINLSIDKNEYLVPLTFQFLIENAIKHNLINKQNHLNIKIYRDNKLIIVENNINPKKDTNKGSGIGLINLKKRYAHFSNFPIEIKKDQHIFQVKIPIIYD